MYYRKRKSSDNSAKNHWNFVYSEVRCGRKISSKLVDAAEYARLRSKNYEKLPQSYLLQEMLNDNFCNNLFGGFSFNMF